MLSFHSQEKVNIGKVGRYQLVCQLVIIETGFLPPVDSAAAE
jgi:hypothetical protein